MAQQISLAITVLLMGEFISPGAAKAAQPGFTSPSIATGIYSDSSGLTASVINNNPMSCSNSSNLRLLMSSQNYATIASMIITGFSGGKTMQFYVNACDSDGSSLITAVSVQK